MAKGKTPKSNKTKLAARGKQKASAQAGGKVKAAKAAPKEPASESAAFTGIAIGHAAGEIWGFLSSDGGQTLGAIQKSVGARLRGRFGCRRLAGPRRQARVRNDRPDGQYFAEMTWRPVSPNSSERGVSHTDFGARPKPDSKLARSASETPPTHEPCCEKATFLAIRRPAISMKGGAFSHISGDLPVIGLLKYVAIVLMVVVSSTAQAQRPNDDDDADHDRPVYQRRAFEWQGRHNDRRNRGFDRSRGWAPPQVNAGWFQRPYPYHLDYYKMRYGGSYAPYFGNLYGPPQVVTAPPYYGPYGNFQFANPGGEAYPVEYGPPTEQTAPISQLVARSTGDDLPAPQ